MLAAKPSLPYALFEYLDISCRGNFGGLVYGDYEAILPVPFSGQSIVQPFISQQLGVFSNTAIDPLPFYDQLAKLSNHIAIKIHNSPDFNPGNKYHKNSRTNFLLPLNKSYVDIFKNYSKTLRKRIRRQKDEVILVENVPLPQVINLYRSQLESKVKIGAARYAQAQTLFDYCLDQGLAKTFGIRNTENEWLAAGVFLVHERRLINVFAASSELGLAKHGMALLLDGIIEKYAGADWLFDFEGSDIPGVKSFFQSFSPIEQAYLAISLDRRSYFAKVMDKVKSKMSN